MVIISQCLSVQTSPSTEQHMKKDNNETHTTMSSHAIMSNTRNDMIHMLDRHEILEIIRTEKRN